MSFAVRGTPGGGITVVEVGGEVDVETAPRMRAALEAALATGDPVVVDLAAVTFMDSAGFGVLASAQRRAAQDGVTVRLRAVPDRVRRLLVLLGLDAVLPIEPDARAGAEATGPFA
jgi:anti-sigma B factor antagonist